MPFVCFVFKTKAETNFEKVVQWFSGPVVHVEIIPLELKIMFTSYMFEHFSVNRFVPYDRTKYEVFKINLDLTEYERFNQLLVELVERKIPYNYMDLLKIGTNVSLFDDDEDYKSIDEVETLFCSQAATFILKQCMQDENLLKTKFQDLNSRFTTPLVLYNIIKTECQIEDSLYI